MSRVEITQLDPTSQRATMQQGGV